MIFDDEDFEPLSANARHVLLTARLCREAGPAAIFRYRPEVLSRQTRRPVRIITEALEELAQLPRPHEPWIVYDRLVLWIRNGLRHDPTTVLANPKHRKGVERWLADLPKSPIVLTFCDYYQLPYPFERDSIATCKPIDSTESESEEDRRRPSPSPSPSSLFAVAGEPRIHTPLVPPGFTRFWASYPKRVGRGAALSAWAKAGCEQNCEAVLLGLARQQAYLGREGGRFVPLPATWLNQRRWEDDPPAVADGVSTATQRSVQHLQAFVAEGGPPP